MITVHRIPVLADNYCFVLEAQGEAVVVDPPEVEPVVRVLEAAKLHPRAVWVTHHHGDHTAGIAGLLERYGRLPVYASHPGGVPCQTDSLKEGDSLEFGGETVRVLEVPGHARGHLAFHLPESGHVFSGDVVFGASCGKVFEGTFEEMYGSVQRIAALPEDTRIWCGHEYTLGNLKFAATVDPDNQRLQARLRQETEPTVPLLVATEKATNPFMRCDSAPVLAYTGRTDPVAVFTELRRRKDR